MHCEHTSVVSIFEKTVQRFPHRPACSCNGTTYTYAELANEVDRAAGHLAALGVTPGERVALALPNTDSHLIALLAVLKLGAVAVAHNPQFTGPELQALFAHHGARVAIAWSGCAIPPGVKTVWADPTGIAWPSDATAPAFPEPSGPALILHTSGTTGAPKGAVLTHANLAANAQQIRAWVPGLIDGQERFLACLPMFHSYGLTMSITVGLTVGAHLILVPRPTPDAVVEAITAYRPTWMPAVPTLYERVIDRAAELGADLRGIKYSISGAAALPAHLVATWEELTGGLLVEGYGLTEASPVLTCNPLDETRRIGSIGKPVPGTELKLDPAGELLARGPQVFSGYLDGEHDAFTNGWLRTGDICTEEGGYYTLVGRKKEIIKVSGFSVYPAEVEEVLRHHPAVTQAAVVDTGQVTACVVASTPVSEADLRAFCRTRLTGYKVPRRVLFFPELPADGLGKLRRADIRALAHDALNS